MPKEVREVLAEARLASRRRGEQNGGETPEVVSEAKQEESAFDEGGIEENQKKFMEMLKENRVRTSTKWEQVQQNLKTDERWNLFPHISDKKRVFHDYIQLLKKKERNDQRTKMEQARENFRKMLEESKQLNSDSKMHKTQQFYTNDNRWKSIEEREREALYQDFLDELYDREREEQRRQKKENQEVFKQKLLEMPNVSASLRWEECRNIFQNDANFNALSEYDQLSTFAEAIMSLEKSEQEERRRQKRTNERHNREAFRQLLAEKLKENVITHKTKWKGFSDALFDDPRIINMVGQPGSTP